MSKQKQKTLFIDIDGTILVQPQGGISQIIYRANRPSTSQKLPYVTHKLNNWRNEGCIIILVTARPESMRDITTQQLTHVGLFYDQLIMGVGHGERYLINNRKDTKEDTAFAINVDRNKGLEDVEI